MRAGNFNNKVTIILIGNYLPDDQISMNRFAGMLNSGYTEAGISNEIWHPKVFFGNFTKNTSTGFGKWLGYIDKWIIFPLILKRRINKAARKGETYLFHICDHSNAPYLKHLPNEKTIITCHDVLAIMGALGFPNTYCESSSMGKYLQNWILKNLSASKKLAAVSNQTLNQLKSLTSASMDKSKQWCVIHNGFNKDFGPMPLQDARSVVNTLGLSGDFPFLLHVGSGQPRKNRQLLIEMISILKDKWEGKICFAGEGLDLQLLSHASALGVSDRIISAVNPDHQQLMALYCACDAFVFPSYSEGFGWPLIEAQACGAPVIASNIEPMPEVTGGAAIHRDPHHAEGFATAFLTLQDKTLRNELVQRGFENSHRFDTRQMIRDYIRLHGLNQN